MNIDGNFTNTTNSTNLTDCEYPEASDLEIRFVIFVVCFPTIAIIGVFGNLLSICIFQQRDLRNSNNLLLSCLAACNIGVLVTATMTYSVEIAYDYLPSLPMYHAWLKYLSTVYFLSNALQTSSIYFTIAATVERWHASRTVYPISIERTTQLAVAVLAACFAINVLRLFELEVIWKPECDGFAEYALLMKAHARTKAYQQFSFWLWTLVSVFIPFSFLTVMNVIVIMKFKDLEHLRNIDIGRTSESLLTKQRRRLVRERQREATILLICVVSLFLLCNLPGFFLALLEVISEKFLKNHRKFYSFARDAINFLAVVDSSSGFFLYVAFGHKFRQLSKEMIFRIVRIDGAFTLIRSITEMELRRPSASRPVENETNSTYRNDEAFRRQNEDFEFRGQICQNQNLPNSDSFQDTETFV